MPSDNGVVRVCKDAGSEEESKMELDENLESVEISILYVTPLGSETSVQSNEGVTSCVVESSSRDNNVGGFGSVVSIIKLKTELGKLVLPAPSTAKTRQ